MHLFMTWHILCKSRFFVFSFFWKRSKDWFWLVGKGRPIVCLSEQNMSPWCCCRSCPVSTAVRTALYTAQHRHYGHQSTSGRGRDRWWSTRGRVRAATSPVYSPGVVTAQGGRVQLSEPRTPDMKCDVMWPVIHRIKPERGEGRQNYVTGNFTAQQY